MVPKTIIFCQTKNICAKVYRLLLKAAERKCAVSMYHASLTRSTRVQVLHDFKSGRLLQCISATVAFGMVKLASKRCVQLLIS